VVSFSLSRRMPGNGSRLQLQSHSLFITSSRTLHALLNVIGELLNFNLLPLLAHVQEKGIYIKADPN
jgi:hypothetical protein